MLDPSCGFRFIAWVNSKDFAKVSNFENFYLWLSFWLDLSRSELDVVLEMRNDD
jgi:hypothetical protein